MKLGKTGEATGTQVKVAAAAAGGHQEAEVIVVLLHLTNLKAVTLVRL